MDYLNKSQVKPDNIVRIYLDGKLEAFGKLIKREGDITSFIHEDDKKVCVQERWLVEWVGMDQIKKKDIKDADHFTQRLLQGKRTHRRVQYIISKTWEGS